MPKRATRSQSRSAALPPSQLRAIERLIEQGDHAAAAKRLRSLVQAYPDQSGPRRLLVQALEGSEGPTAAAVAAFEWAERRPNSLIAQQALLHYAARLGYLFLAHRIAARISGLGGDAHGFHLDPAVLAKFMIQPDGTTASFEQMIWLDIGKLHVDGQDFSNALRWLEDVDLIPARNNYAMSLFHLGRIDEALAAFMASWEVDPGNLFALGWAARLRLYRGDEAGARQLRGALMSATARRIDDAWPQLHALLLLQENDAAWSAYERISGYDWLVQADHLGKAMLMHLAACAASRLGQDRDAQRLWEATTQLSPDFRPARINLEGEAGDFHSHHPVVYDLAHFLPLVWLKSVREGGAQALTNFERVTASNVYLDTLYVAGEAAVRQLSTVILSERARQGDLDAVARLKHFATLPIGTKAERYEHLRALQRAGRLERDEILDYWDGVQQTKIRLLDILVTREREASGLPEDLDIRLGESVDRFNKRDYAAAESLLREILERVPNHPIVLGNLASVRMVQGHEDEAQALLRRVVTEHPDYLVARCNLAIMLIQEGKLDEGQTLLDGLTQRPRLHIQDMFLLYGVLAMLSRARDDHETADNLLAALENLVEDEDDERWLTMARRLQTRVGPMGRLARALRRSAAS